jgi:hypothetical protein
MSRARLIFLFSLIFQFATPARAEILRSGEVGLSAGWAEPSDSILNPGNRVLEVEDRSLLLDVRAELKIEGAQSKWVLRPRWTVMGESFQTTDTRERSTRAQGQLDLTDAYWEVSPRDDWQFTAGLFVDGWGPAEFVNPSNPFIHLNFENKSFFYKEKGHFFLRGLWNPSAKTTLSFLSEPVSNREPEFRREQEFEHKWALRGEWQSDDASRLAALLIGQEADAAPFVGEYFQWRHDPTGFSVYFEARHTQDPRKFQVRDTGPFPFRELTLQTEKGVRTYSVTGLRWEGRVDARIEWITYDLGYSEIEWDQILAGLTMPSPYLIENGARFSRPGLEFSTRNWGSLSIRIPDLGPRSDWQWTHRVLWATGDKVAGTLRSGLYQSLLEMPAWEAWTFFGEFQHTFGRENTEMKLRNHESAYLGARGGW